MNNKTSIRPYAPTGPASSSGRGRPAFPSGNLLDQKPPRTPDWLLILMIAMVLVTVLIAWLVDIPALLR